MPFKVGDTAYHRYMRCIVDVQSRRDPVTDDVSCTWTDGLKFMGRRLCARDMVIVPNGCTLEQAAAFAETERSTRL